MRVMCMRANKSLTSELFKSTPKNGIEKCEARITIGEMLRKKSLNDIILIQNIFRRCFFIHCSLPRHRYHSINSHLVFIRGRSLFSIRTFTLSYECMSACDIFRILMFDTRSYKTVLNNRNEMEPSRTCEVWPRKILLWSVSKNDDDYHKYATGED